MFIFFLFPLGDLANHKCGPFCTFTILSRWRDRGLPTDYLLPVVL